MSIFKSALRRAFAAFLSRKQRRKLGAFILNEADSDGNGDAATNGEYAFLQNFVGNLKSAPCVAIDAGANVGSWSLEFLKLAPKQSRVLAFEPAVKTYERLCQNLASDSRATPVNAALSDTTGEGSLHLAGELCGTNSIHRQNIFQDGKCADEKIRLVTGDAFCSERGIQKIDFIKIDTEGHELAVMRGFDNMLSNKLIGAIQFEYGGTWLDARIQLADAFTYLQSKGYAMAKIYPNGLKYIECYDQSMDTFKYANFAAVLPKLGSGFAEIA